METSRRLVAQYPVPVPFGGPVFARVKHLNLTGSITHRDANAAGHGGFSEVFKGRCRFQVLEETEVTVAIKRLRYHLLSNGVNMEKIFEKEIYVWSKLNHPNVLRLMGFAFCEETGFPLLISRWMEKGSAWSYIMANPHLTLAQRCRIVVDTAEGLRYLHNEEKLVHGDIKADNVVIDHDGRALIGDFGCARFSEASLSVADQSTGLKGTPRYWAPELASVSSVQIVYSEATDMWAFGMTVYEIIVRHRPFEGLNEIQTFTAVSQGQSPPIPFEHKNDLGSEQSLFEDICRCCWSLEPGHRPSAQWVLAKIAEETYLLNPCKLQQTNLGNALVSLADKANPDSEPYSTSTSTKTLPLPLNTITMSSSGNNGTDGATQTVTQSDVFLTAQDKGLWSVMSGNLPQEVASGSSTIFHSAITECNQSVVDGNYDSVVKPYAKASDPHSSGPPDLALSLSALNAGYRRYGSSNDLEKCVQLLSEVLVLRPPYQPDRALDQPDRALSLKTLAEDLRSRYKRSSLDFDLKKCMDLLSIEGPKAKKA